MLGIKNLDRVLMSCYIGALYRDASRISNDLKLQRNVSESSVERIREFLDSCIRGEDMRFFPLDKLLKSLGTHKLEDFRNYERIFYPVVDKSKTLSKNLETYLNALKRLENRDEDSAMLLKNLFNEVFDYVNRHPIDSKDSYGLKLAA